MASIRFEGREVGFVEGDTVASALYRNGVRTFSRSLKYHRRRGLYCGTGDCPNCLITVDGQPATRSCQTSCRDGMTVAREDGWPSTEHDLLHVTDSLHRLMPVGFYYKTFIRPRFAWEVAEKVIRRSTGLGTLPQTLRGGAQGGAERALRRPGGRRRERGSGGRAQRGLRRRAGAALRRVDDRRRDRAGSVARPRARAGGGGSGVAAGHRAGGPRRDRHLRGDRGAPRRGGRARPRPPGTCGRGHGGRGDPPGVPRERPARDLAGPRSRADGRRPRRAPRRRRGRGRGDRGSDRAHRHTAGGRSPHRRGRGACGARRSRPGRRRRDRDRRGGARGTRRQDARSVVLAARHAGEALRVRHAGAVAGARAARRARADGLAR